MIRAIPLLCIALASLPVLAGQYHTSPACWSDARIYAESQDAGPPVDIERVEGVLRPPFFVSPNRAYAAALERPEPGLPGDFELTVYQERPYLLRLRLPDARAVEDPRWINEKLLFVRVWWGRVAGTDFLLDVEAEVILHREGLRYGAIAFQQFQQCSDPDWRDTESCRCYSGQPEGFTPGFPLDDRP